MEEGKKGVGEEGVEGGDSWVKGSWEGKTWRKERGVEERGKEERKGRGRGAKTGRRRKG